MTEQPQTWQAEGPVQPGTLAPDPSELTDAELALVTGGGDGPPVGVGDGNGRSGV